MRERETVLITGGSGGMGAEFAKIFAKEGFHVVLAARSEDKMKALAEKLNQKYGNSCANSVAAVSACASGQGAVSERASGQGTVSVQDSEYRVRPDPQTEGKGDLCVEYIPADLSRPGGAEALWAEVQRRGLKVDQLVNNAGAGKAGRVVDAAPEVMEGLITLNVTSLTVLCRMAGAAMAERGYGKILNISSTAGMFPDPYFNVYGPSKAYVLALTEAMKGELKGTGVTVTALCPGPVRTNWAKNAGKAYPAMAADPARVARIGFEAMQKGRLCAVPGIFTKTGTFFLTRCLPRSARVGIGAMWQRAMIRKDEKKRGSVR